MSTYFQEAILKFELQNKPEILLCCMNFQEAIQKFDFEWQSLLQSDLGLSEVGFRELLFHRHEMQEGAYLEEEEKKPVHILRKRYEMDRSELV